MFQSSFASRRYFRHALLGTLIFLSNFASAESIATGGKTGTYFRFGQDLEGLIATKLEVLPTQGSVENILLLSHMKNVSLAIVQSDVYAAYVNLRDDKTQASSVRQKYTTLLENLRVFMPLYKEEIHFLVRKDSTMEFIHEIEDKEIWMDVENSGTNITAVNIYNKMFHKAPRQAAPKIHPSATGDDLDTKRWRSGLMALSEPEAFDRFARVDVMVLVGGQPLGLLEKNVPSNLKLLKFDRNHSTAAGVIGEYQMAEIRKTSYPLINFTGTSTPSLSVDSYLFTAAFRENGRNQYVNTIAYRFCDHLDKLKEKGHSKWNDLIWSPGTPLPQLAAGWRYSGGVRRILNTCKPI